MKGRNKDIYYILAKGQYYEGEVWAVYLTPAEIRELRDWGLKFESDISYIEEDIRAGKCNPRWVYYYQAHIEWPGKIRQRRQMNK